MRTPASVARHPIHPMLVTIPIGLWLFSLFCDVMYLWGNGDADWATVAFYTAAGGIAGALLAAVPGLIDLLSLPQGPRRTALIHMSLNLTVVVLYAINVWLRTASPDDLRTPFFLSVIGILVLAVSGWLGGKMVYEYGVGVSADEGTVGETSTAPGQRFTRHVHS